uniref:Uncharacterized protein n=1 Tax=Moniliophthora roreri TaxID=221103 RepID=A0A0W0FHM1_MONRR
MANNGPPTKSATPPNLPPSPKTPPPKCLPPFQKAKPDTNMKAILAGSVPSSPSKNHAQSVAAKLIVCNAYIPTEKVHNPVVAVSTAVQTLHAEHPDTLGLIPVVVELFCVASAHLAMCYISLHLTIAVDNEMLEPRIDLLLQWQHAIMSAHPCLEVEFTPTKDGSDKRMWVQVPGVLVTYKNAHPKPNSKESTAPPTIDHIKGLIQQHFEKEKILLSNLFSVGQNTVVIELALPSNADSIIKSKSILIPSISPYYITVHSGQHLSIQNLLELIIMGLSRF